MTDNEIIKALECCGEPKQIGCTHCPMSEDCMNGRLDICTLTLDLIKRLKAKNKKLNDKIGEMCIESVEAHNEFVRQRRRDCIEAEREAYKELAERLKKGKQMFPRADGTIYAVSVSTIDRILAEMVGDNNV